VFPWQRTKRKYNGIVSIKIVWIEDVDDLYDDPPVVDQNVIPYNLPTQTRYMSDLHMQKLHDENFIFVRYTFRVGVTFLSTIANFTTSYILQSTFWARPTCFLGRGLNVNMTASLA
jgi:hypothetical protein